MIERRHWLPITFLIGDLMAIRLLIFVSALVAVGIASFVVWRFTRSGLGQKLGELFLTLFYLVVTIAVFSSALVYPMRYFRSFIITIGVSLLLVVMLRRSLKMNGSTDNAWRRLRTSVLNGSYLSLGTSIAIYAAFKMDD